MKSMKYFVPMLLLCVLLANEFKQIDSQDVSKDNVMDTVSYMSGLMGMLPLGPFGPMMSAGLGMLQLSAKIFTSGESDVLTKTDFLVSQAKISNAITNVNTHVQESQIMLTHEIQSYEIMEDMRNDLDTLREAFDDSMKVILNPKITGITKKTRMNAMLDYFSDFRQILRSFVSKYIQTKGFVSSQGQVKLFFDFILSKERLETRFGEDCHSESTHTKLFKSYIYILKTLTDAYVMAVSAHTIEYQTELKRGTENAIETQNFGLKLLNQYKADMKLFMDKAKWAMDTSSREIRNCGKFELKQGETFESVSFGHTLPKFKDYNYDHSKHYNPLYSFPDYRCFTNMEKDVRYADYEIDGECTDGVGSKKGTSVKVFVNSSNTNWPYLYMEFGKTWPWDSPVYFGHYKTGPGVVTRPYSFLGGCQPSFCPAFKKNAVAISTQIVSAKPEYVITGLRFRKRENIFFLDIQQGKVLDDFSVDPKTVIWTETPKNDNILYLSAKIRKLELGAVELKKNQYLTSIQLKLKNEVDGIIGLYVGGGRAPNWTSSGLTGSSYTEKSNEFKLSECDNPEQFGAGVKNMVSKVPDPSKPYHISFQPTDLKKDFGISTIPYIDMREVYTNPPSPLGGFGLYHQAVDGSGGFISLKLMALNFSSYIDYKFIEAIDTTIKV